jgi:hypothetical protein
MRGATLPPHPRQHRAPLQEPEIKGGGSLIGDMGSPPLVFSIAFIAKIVIHITTTNNTFDLLVHLDSGLFAFINNLARTWAKRIFASIPNSLNCLIWTVDYLHLSII